MEYLLGWDGVRFAVVGVAVAAGLTCRSAAGKTEAGDDTNSGHGALVGRRPGW
jgi:hypothetical protein